MKARRQSHLFCLYIIFSYYALPVLYPLLCLPRYESMSNFAYGLLYFIEVFQFIALK